MSRMECLSFFLTPLVITVCFYVILGKMATNAKISITLLIHFVLGRGEGVKSRNQALFPRQTRLLPSSFSFFPLSTVDLDSKLASDVNRSSLSFSFFLSFRNRYENMREEKRGMTTLQHMKRGNGIEWENWPD